MISARPLSGDQYLYTANDARHLPELVRGLQKELYAASLDAISKLEMELIPWAARAEVAGVPADADAFDTSIRSLAQEQADFTPRIEAAMKESGFDPTRFYQSKRKTASGAQHQFH